MSKLLSSINLKKRLIIATVMHYKQSSDHLCHLTGSKLPQNVSIN